MTNKRLGIYPTMEVELFEFVIKYQETAAFTDELLWIKANDLLESTTPGATVSTGWVQNFKRRHGIKQRKMHGEAGSVDTSNLDSERKILADIIEEYEPRDVFNMDETGLLFRMEPSETLATKSTAGKKKDKTRITIGLCSNMDGSENWIPL